jgi:hypothetical protein
MIGCEFFQERENVISFTVGFIDVIAFKNQLEFIVDFFQISSEYFEIVYNIFLCFALHRFVFGMGI